MIKVINRIPSLPISRLYPSHLLISKEMYSFSRVKTITNYNLKNHPSIHYYVLKTDVNPNSKNERYSVADITHLDYSFFYLPYIHYHPDRLRTTIEYPERHHVHMIKGEVDDMLRQYHITYPVDYYRVDDNLYINFSESQKPLILIDGDIQNGGC